MEQPVLLPHLFRTEYRKIVSVLCKHFGFGQVETAEDIAGETFLAAAQTWGLSGVPPQPVAWLYHVARNKARNHLNRQRLFRAKVSRGITGGDEEVPELDLSPQNIIDSQLQMMFAVCHPAIPQEAQVALALRILCGFGIEEIADAFLTGKDTINKRLYRGKEKLREAAIPVAMPPTPQLDGRLGSVLRTIYLLFSEGYFSSSHNEVLRKDLCLEAMRLCRMLAEHPPTDKPEVNALMALMCFHASRFDARMDEVGGLVLYEEQDTGLWDSDLIARGAYYLHRAAYGERLSKYHLEAAIAYWNTQRTDTAAKWEQVLQLYDHLLALDPSPVVALNRAYALFKLRGKEEAIAEAEALCLSGNPVYHALLGELYTGLDNERARRHFEEAIRLAKAKKVKQSLEKKKDRLPL